MLMLLLIAAVTHVGGDPYSGMSIKNFDVDTFERKELPLYRRMAAQQPDQYDVNAELGLKLLATIFRRPRAGMHSQEALSAFQRAYRNDPNHPSAAVLLNNLGLLLKAMGRPAEAVDAHTRAIAQNTAAPDGASSQRLEAEALYARSQARAMLAHHDAAVLDLHAALEAYPAHVAALREIAKQRDESRLPMPRQHYVDLAEALLGGASPPDRAELHMARSRRLCDLRRHCVTLCARMYKRTQISCFWGAMYLFLLDCSMMCCFLLVFDPIL